MDLNILRRDPIFMVGPDLVFSSRSNQDPYPSELELDSPQAMTFPNNILTFISKEILFYVEVGSRSLSF